MICCCSLAGTAACENCNNRQYINFYIDTKELRPITSFSKKNIKIECTCKGCEKAITILDNFCSNCGTKNEQKYIDGSIME